VNWTVEDYERYKAKWAGAVVGRIVLAPAVCECDPRGASVEKETHPRPNGQTHIVYRSYRHRLLDYDNLWSKYVTDALVDCGILAADTPEALCVSHEQVKIGRGETERTVVEIREGGK
jgi:hypothetical protein